ncbi:MAG: hypothetical protein HYV02_08785 [Deltaproteobacteria bacterium]|nr:hypothetical protein [Deltaproteobacteria bacterium]
MKTRPPTALQQATGHAVAETAAYAHWRRDYRAPVVTVPRQTRSSAATLSQWFWKGLDRYHERRTLDDAIHLTMGAPCGPLPLAVERALTRMEPGKAAPVLEIGAGQRLVAAGLKALFGDRIFLAEVSPKFTGIPNVIDLELAQTPIENCRLPANTFQFIYSLFGSYYARDQIALLGNVLQSVMVGGEAFLITRNNRRFRRLSEAVTQHHADASRFGIAMACQEWWHDDGSRFGVRYGSVWLKKLAEDADLLAYLAACLMQLHRPLPASSPPPSPIVHLCTEGPALPSEEVPDAQRQAITAALIETSLHAWNLSRDTFCYKVSQTTGDEVFAAIVAQCVQWSTQSPHIPLTTIIRVLLDQVYAIRDSDLTLPAMKRDDWESFLRHINDPLYQHG